MNPSPTTQPNPRPADEAVASAGVWRKGRVLVMARQATLPHRCIKCNAPANYRLSKTLSYKSVGTWVSEFVFEFFIDLFVAMISPGTSTTSTTTVPDTYSYVTIEIPLCENHRYQSRTRTILAWLLGLGGVGLFVVGFLKYESKIGPVLVFGGLLSFVVGITFGFMASLLKVQKMNDQRIWLRRASRAYLDTLPVLTS